MKRTKISKLVFAASVLSSSWAQADVYDKIIAPLIAKCPDFISGDAQIRINSNMYSMWETGRHLMGGECYVTTKMGDSVIATQQEKFHSDANPTVDGMPVDEPRCAEGSIINVDAQAVGESVSIVGAPFSLVYFSNNSIGSAANNTINIPVFDANPNVTDFDIVGTYAGRTLLASYVNTPALVHKLVWDGKDNLGNMIVGTTRANFKVILHAHGKEIPITYSAPLGGYKAEAQGFGGWQPSIFHFYDFASERLYRGDGSSALLKAKNIGSGIWRVVENDGENIYVFSADGKHISTLFNLTGEAKYTFNYTSNLLTSIVEPYGKTTTFTRTGDLVTSITSPFGQVTTLAYDANDLLESITAPDSTAHEMTYHSGSGLLATFQKSGGQVSSFDYDAKGHLIEDAHSGGYVQTLLTTFQTSGHNDRVVTRTTPMGREQKLSLTNSLSTTKEYSRIDQSLNGEQSLLRTSPFSTSVNYITSGYRTTEQRVLDSRFANEARYTSRKSFSVGNRTLETMIKKESDLSDASDPFSFSSIVTETVVKGKKWISQYTKATKELLQTSPEGRTSKTTFNAYEQVVAKQVAALLPTTFEYNVNGLLASVSQGARTTKYQYNSLGYMSAVTDAIGNKTSYETDGKGRVLSKTYPDGRQERYSYDANGNLISVKPASKPVHHFEFNSSEELAKYIPPLLAGAGETVYQYNLDKELTKIILPSGQEINYVYWDTAQKLGIISTPLGNYEYTYDDYHALDRPTKISSPDGTDLVYTYYGPYTNSEAYYASSEVTPYARLKFFYDDQFRRDRTALTDGGDHTLTILHRYDNDGLLIKSGDMYIKRGSRAEPLEVKVGEGAVRYLYDNQYGQNREIDYVAKGRSLFHLSYERDALGRIISETENLLDKSRTRQFVYDKSGRLKGNKNPGSDGWNSYYVYDDNGNRTSGFENGKNFTASYDVQDRLVKWNETAFTYDANGMMATKSGSSGDFTYTYDVFGNLLSVVKNGPGQLSKTITYEIDGKNRRVSRSVNGTVVRYVYDGQLQLIAQLSGTGVLQKYFVYGTSHSPDYMTAGNKKYQFIKDARGSIRKVVDVQTGQIKQSLSYDDWGVVTEDTNPGFQPFGFAGGLYDGETKLLRFGARDYDAEVGRWTAKDPIRFDGGDLNLYGYGLTDPINNIDPDGKVALVIPIILPIIPIVEVGIVTAAAYACHKAPEIVEAINDVIAAIKDEPKENCQQTWTNTYNNCINRGNEPAICIERAGNAYNACVQRSNAR